MRFQGLQRRSERSCTFKQSLLSVALILVTKFARSEAFHLPGPEQCRWKTSLSVRSDLYYEDYDEPYEDEEEYYERPASSQFPVARSPRETLSFNGVYDQAERYFTSEEETPDTAAGGNFWANPEPRFDTKRGRTSQPRGASSGRPRKATFRSGAPPPPPPVSDFYNRLFWFGFDPTETTSRADKTMFGGTKGKFSGLAYIGAEDQRDYVRRRRPRNRPRNDWEDEEDDDSEDENTENFVESRSPQPSRSVTPPYDVPYPRRAQPMPSAPRARRAPRANRDWVTNEVSSWFDDTNEESSEFESTRKRRKRKSSWSPWNAFDVFLGLDRDDLDEQAEAYSQQMGPVAERGRRRKARDPSRSKSIREPGKTIDYDISDEEQLEYDPRALDDVERDSIIDADVEIEDDKPERKAMSWEERSLAVERVPPADIPAWGPSGELNIDARTKAISDALEDISASRQNVKDRERKVELTKEELTILRVDSELERKRLRSGRRSARAIQEEIRVIDFKIDEAARALRYASIQLQAAKEDLAEMENRHWAVLSFYDPSKASEEVVAAFNEFHENEGVVQSIPGTENDEAAAIEDPIDDNTDTM